MNFLYWQRNTIVNPVPVEGLYIMNNKKSLAHHTLCLLGIVLLGVLLTACQPKQTEEKTKQSETQASSSSVAEQNYVESKTIKMPGTQPVVCDQDGCTRYNLQTVQTNHAWIDQYFQQRLKKALPVAFLNSAESQSNQTPDDRELTQSDAVVRYIGQYQHIATFEFSTFVFEAHAAHPIHHREYVNFDMKTRKRIALEQLLVSGQEKTILKALFESNRDWLQSRDIRPERLSVSDNFYFAKDGVVFVYPLYELTAYADGMPELTLPYKVAQGRINPEYLPSLTVPTE